ncbi:MAG: response regulator [Magnetococcales bacterium]|nr:response regulator [Magnetococcales bacterium]
MHNSLLDRFRTIPISLGSRIFLGFGVVIVVFFIQAAIGRLGLDNTSKGFDRFEKINTDAFHIMEIERNVLELQRNVTVYTQTGYKGVINRVYNQNKILQEQLQAVKGSVNDQQRQNILRRMIGHFESYAEHFEVAIKDRQHRDQLMDERLEVAVEQISLGLESRMAAWKTAGESEKISSAGVVMEKVLHAHHNALNFLISPRSGQIRSALHHLAQSQQILQKMVHQEGNIPLTKGQREIGRISQMVVEYENDFLQMVQATQGYMNLVYVVMAGESWEFAYLAKKLKELTTAQRDRVQKSMDETIHATQQIGLWVSSFATALGLVLAWLIAQNISEPVKAMTRTLTDLARGKKNAEIPGRGRLDEIGFMAKSAQVFKEKAEELENASRYKSEFLANMSHELRTPLNSMLILSKMLAENRQGNLTSDQVESAEIIHTGGIDLLRLINDILDLSKVEAGKMDVLIGEMDLDHFAASIERLFKPVADSKKLDFVVKIEPETTRNLLTDWAKVEQIIRNFLANAFKFTAEGHVQVHFHHPQRGVTFLNPALSANNTLAITVKDSGIGIHPDKHGQIFEAFLQADGTTSRQYGGTGLGLSISRKLAELLGGEIQVESQYGEGAAFTLYLPLVFPVDERSEQGREWEWSGQAGSRSFSPEKTFFHDSSRTVLLVDDDDRNIFALKQVLKPCVGKVLEAQNGQEALDKLRIHGDEVDLVLMDIMMPVMDGFQAMQAIRQETRFSKLPMLALTAKVMPGDREKCLEAGASDYIAKPVDSQKLLSALSDWLGTPKGEGDPSAPSLIDEKGEAHLQPKDKATSSQPKRLLGREGKALKVLIVDDDMRNTFYLTPLFQDMGCHIVMAQDGTKALSQLENNPDIDLLLMDDEMPKMDGIEATRAIRNNPLFKDLPIIGMCDNPSSGDRERSLSAGMNDQINKPVDLALLLTKVDAFFPNRIINEEGDA